MKPVELWELRWNRWQTQRNDGGRHQMWIALFSIASAAAVCLSVAAILLQANQGDALHGWRRAGCVWL